MYLYIYLGAATQRWILKRLLTQQMVLFHRGERRKKRRKEKKKVMTNVMIFVMFLVILVFLWKKCFPKIKFVLVCMLFTIHRYIAAPLSHLLFLIHTKGLPVFQNSRCFLTLCNITIVNPGTIWTQEQLEHDRFILKDFCRNFLL